MCMCVICEQGLRCVIAQSARQMFSGAIIIQIHSLSIKPHLSALQRIGVKPSVNSDGCPKGRDVTLVSG